MLSVGKHYINSKKLYAFWFSQPSLPQTNDIRRCGNREWEKSRGTELSNLCPEGTMILLIKNENIIGRELSLTVKIIRFHMEILIWVGEVFKQECPESC